MTYIEEFQPPVPTLFETAFNWFIRLLAIAFVGFTLMSWVRVIGYFPGSEYRFDTMSEHWKIAGAILAVLHPVAAVGLWTLLPWGQVVWALAIAIEVSMYTWFSSLFGTNPLLVYFHLACIAVYVSYQAVAFYRVKKA